MAVRGVLFDMDGLLLDTESVYTKSTQALLDPFGETFTWEVKSQMMGKPGHEAGQVLIDAYKLPLSVEEYLEKLYAIQAQMWPQTGAMPGARELVETLKARGVPMAVATSSYRSAFDVKTTTHGDWFAHFDAIVCGDDARIPKGKGKPCPHIYHVAAEALGMEAADCLVFEDSLTGVQAGTAAGARVVMVPDARMDRTLCGAATQVLGSLEEFDVGAWTWAE